jgi:hypothetical protein
MVVPVVPISNGLYRITVIVLLLALTVAPATAHGGVAAKADAICKRFDARWLQQSQPDPALSAADYIRIAARLAGRQADSLAALHSHRRTVRSLIKNVRAARRLLIELAAATAAGDDSSSAATLQLRLTVPDRATDTAATYLGAPHCASDGPEPYQRVEVTQQVFNSNGDPLLVANPTPDGSKGGDAVVWRTCPPGGSSCVPATGTHGRGVEPGEVPAGTVFEASATYLGRTTVARSGPWGGRVTSTAPPVLQGEAVVGATVTP